MRGRRRKRFSGRDWIFLGEGTPHLGFGKAWRQKVLLLNTTVVPQPTSLDGRYHAGRGWDRNQIGRKLALSLSLHTGQIGLFHFPGK